MPSRLTIDANVEALARYAALCQDEDLVPIVEPEVLMDGNHLLARWEEVTEDVLESVFRGLFAHRVQLEGVVLKPNMVISGTGAPNRAGPEEVAEATLRCLRRHVPAAVPGIAFLSGGQSEAEATHHLSLMNQIGGVPWQLSFSFGRALQQTALARWAGKAENIATAQQSLDASQAERLGASRQLPAPDGGLTQPLPAPTARDWRHPSRVLYR